VAGSVASFTGDGAYDQDGVYRAVADHQPDAVVIVPPRSTAVPSGTAATEPTQRDRHLQGIAEKGRIGWQKMSGYNKRSRVEAAIGRYMQVIGGGLRSRKDGRRTTEVGVAVHVLNRMLEVGRPISVRIGRMQMGWGYCDPFVKSMQHPWTPPSGQGETSGLLRRVVGCCHPSGL
jgi:hypothetical protein